MNDDSSLLRRYAEEGSQDAFAQVVRRHVDLVYGAALRRTHGDPHCAADVAQQVFTRLAREARKLARHPVLVAWLHTATRSAAINLMISEQRRQIRERQALALDSVSPTGSASPDWERVQPLLDAAIDELPEPDRAAVVLRFLERRAYAEIGLALRISEEAARMRTDRALDKLRAVLARRGITSTAAALAAIVSSQPLVSAPAGLAGVLVSQALAAAGTGAGLLAPLSLLMNTKTIAAAAVSALLSFGVGTYVGLRQSSDAPSPPPLAASPHQTQIIASLRQDNRALKTEVARLKADLEQLDSANVQLAAHLATPPPLAPRPKSVTLGMARWEVQQAALNNLRQIDAARTQFQLEKGRPAGSINELVGRGSFIKTVRTVAGEDYSGLSMIPQQPLTVTTPDGITVTYDPSGATTTRPEVPPEVLRVQELAPRVQGSINQALNAFRAANNGANPPNEQALMPYFATPQESAAFVEFLDARKAAGP